MKREATGGRITLSTLGEPIEAFLPKPLPPTPPVQIDGILRASLDEALLALGRLDSVATLLSDTSLFQFMYVRKEAVLSSQIEGMQSSLSDILLLEMDETLGVSIADAHEVLRCVAALEHGLERLREGFPLSNRLVREIHGQLFDRGADKKAWQPGEFRTSQNWIGGPRPGLASHVPPPPERVPGCMGDLERFLHEPADRVPALVKTALAHVQFETIHPFLDGNGRVGRILIPLLLASEGVLHTPLLYLSHHFNAHRRDYYDLLQRVRLDGDWEAWLQFFADGIRETAEDGAATARSIVELFERDRLRIQGHRRAVGSAHRVHHALKQRPVASIPLLAEATGLSAPTVSAALRMLERLGIVRELTGKRRNRLFGYNGYVALFEEGMQLGWSSSRHRQVEVGRKERKKTMGCAYCDAKGTMTREHVFSDWIGRKFSDIGAMESTLQGAPDRHFQGLIKTKDVCSTCNNEELSELDNFAKALGMHDDRSAADSKVFHGDRDKLIRYLLKCGYNDVRANLEKAQSARHPTRESADLVREHKQLTQYILGRGASPMPLDVVAGLIQFSPSVGAGRMDLKDSGNRIHFNRWLHLAKHCFLVIGWRDGTANSYKEAMLNQLCSPPWNWTWLKQDPFDVRLRHIAVAGTILPSGETLPEAAPN